ncbi:MAG TPA: alpha/beta hydrolase [Vitreimonas sp.]|nr:alpha/beta hydrolase [Vitreimonas sp.]
MTFVYFHGSFGSPDENWVGYLERELNELGHHLLRPRFPADDWDRITTAGQATPPQRQSLHSWMRSFDEFYETELKNHAREPMVFIGHSLGPVFILHVLEKYQLKIDAAFFVAPFLSALATKWQFDHVNYSFYKTDFDFANLRELITKSYVVYGHDDPYVPQTRFFEFADKMGSAMIEVKGGKHLSKSGGFTEFPLLLELCKTRIFGAK